MKKIVISLLLVAGLLCLSWMASAQTPHKVYCMFTSETRVLSYEIEVDMEKGIITTANGESIEFKKLPPFMLEILNQGGLIEYLKNKR